MKLLNAKVIKRPGAAAQILALLINCTKIERGFIPDEEKTGSSQNINLQK